MDNTENTFEKIYRIVARIPRGSVTTYGQIARMLGNPRLSRIVGCALYAAPNERRLPCHRVVDRSGRLSAVFKEEQRFLLDAEGVAFQSSGNVDLTRHMWCGGIIDQTP